jgi:hypothetical protein
LLLVYDYEQLQHELVLLLELQLQQEYLVLMQEQQRLLKNGHIIQKNRILMKRML